MNKDKADCSNKDILNKAKLFIILDTIVGFQQLFGVIMPLFFLSYKGFDVQQYILFEVVMSISIFVFEIPSGYIADKVGRKQTMMFSLLLAIVSTLLLIIISNSILLLCIAALAGFATALCSGLAGSMVYSVFTFCNQSTEDLERYYSRISAFSYITSTIATVASGVLFSLNMILPLVLDVILMAILFIAVIFTFPQERTISRERKEEFVDNNVKKGIRVVLKEFNNLLYISVIFAVVFAWSRASFSLYQPVTSSWIKAEYWGVLIAGLNTVSATVAFFSRRIFKRMKEDKSILFLLMVLVCFSSVLFFIPALSLVLLGMVVQQVSRGLLPIVGLRRNYFIKTDANRNLMLSMGNALNTVFMAIFWLLEYCILIVFSEHVALLGIGVLTLLVLLLSVRQYLMQLKKGIIVNYQDIDDVGDSYVS